MDKEARRILSDRFRAYCGTIPLPILQEFERTLRDFLGFKDTRNIQLWTRDTTNKRNFIGATLSGSAFWQRVHIAKGLLGDYMRGVNTDTRLISGDSFDKGRTLRLYLSDPFFVGDDFEGGAFMRLDLSFDGNIILTFEDDSPTGDDVNNRVTAGDSDTDEIFYDANTNDPFGGEV